MTKDIKCDYHFRISVLFDIDPGCDPASLTLGPEQVFHTKLWDFGLSFKPEK